MSATPARDARTDANMLRLEDFVMRALYADPDELDRGARRILRERVERHVAAALANHDLVLAALVEAGWRPSDDDLRAMGGNRGAVSTPLFVWLFPPTKETTDGE